MNLWVQFKQSIRADLSGYQRAVPDRSLLWYYRRFPGFKITFWLRVNQYSRNSRILKSLAIISALRIRRLSLLSGIQIDPGMKIGDGLYIPHSGTIVVNPGAIIKENCYLSHNVTIGKIHAGEKAGSPTIGNDVFIATGSVICGRITIGDNAVIAANSVVLDDVPSGMLAAGNPAKVVAAKSAHTVLGLS